MKKPPITSEWLETDQLGGYASGTSDLIPTRRYHALYVSADPNGTSRQVLLPHPLVEIKVDGTWYPLSSFRFSDGTIHPQGNSLIKSFSNTLWPTWIFKLGELEIQCEFILLFQRPEGVIRWTLLKGTQKPLSLRVRPFLSFRNHHSLSSFDHNHLSFEQSNNQYTFSDLCSKLSITLHCAATFEQERLTYHNFFYQEEQLRGYDSKEDLLTPGFFHFEDFSNTAHIHFFRGNRQLITQDPEHYGALAFEREKKRREKIPTKQARALSQFKILNKERSSLIAGYPWFSEWGRDTFISLRGITAITKDEAFVKQTLLSWGTTVQHGLIPNRFPESSEPAEYNSVDATLWYLIVMGEFLQRAEKKSSALTSDQRQELLRIALDIFTHLRKGTIHQIGVDSDNLLSAGVQGKQLTWMDAKCGEWVVTPRIGKPVEVQALWINTLRLFAIQFKDLEHIAVRAQTSFEQKFWLPDLGYLADVVDVDHVLGTTDISLRPNQLLAFGGLPYPLISKETSARILKIIEHELLTPYGLRTLSDRDSRYHGTYSGDQRTRDASYHQGTVWPWLLGPFIEAWLRVHGDTRESRRLAYHKFLVHLQEHSQAFGGHIHEIFDGNRPHLARGAPFQAWSLGEIGRVENLLRPTPRSFLELVKALLGL